MLAFWGIDHGTSPRGRRLVGKTTKDSASPASSATIVDFDLSPDGRLLATGEESGRVSLWDVQTSHELLAWDHLDGRNAHPKFSPDGMTLAVTLDLFNSSYRKVLIFSGIWPEASEADKGLGRK